MGNGNDSTGEEKPLTLSLLTPHGEREHAALSAVAELVGLS